MDLLVDNTAGHEMLSIMDGFSGYNQIKLAEEDQEKTSFTTPWGTYVVVVMPFGLKLGQQLIRALTAIFHDMMHAPTDKLEVYVEIQDTRRTSGSSVRSRKSQLKMNPKKCVFGVSSGK